MPTIRALTWLAFLISGAGAYYWINEDKFENGLPYSSWYLGFRAPAEMDVWLETAEFIDTKGRVYWNAMEGLVALAYEGNRVGWGEWISMGNGVNMERKGLPIKMYVRWQSLAEPQIYSATFDIPEHVRQLMVSKVPSNLYPGERHYQSILTVGLAPGGWIKLWVMSSSSNAVEVLCTRASIEPRGPFEQGPHGQYIPVAEEILPQLKRNPVIPYDSWACDKPAASASSAFSAVDH